MATVTQRTSVQQIGESAGAIWRVLNDLGPTSLARLPKLTDSSKDAVLLGIGWLAREDKITIEDRGRVKMVSLTDPA